jgi:hypothetical protein
LTRLDDTGTDVIDCGDGDYESIFSRTGAFDLVVELLFDGLDELWAEVTWMEQDFVLEGNLDEMDKIAVLAFRGTVI